MMKSWKILGLLTLLLFAGLSLQAQDIVKLKDGSFVRGTILEYIAGDHVRIKTEEGKYYEYPAADILSTEQGTIKSGHTAREFLPKTKGLVVLAGLGLNLGNRYGSLSAGPGLYTVTGWQWNSHLMTGVGLGVEYLNDAVRVPLTLDARWRFGKGGMTPYVGLNAGYTFSGQSQQVYYYDIWGGGSQVTQNHGGVNAGLKVGFMTQVAPHLGIDVHAGYRYQTLRSDYDQGFWNGSEYITVPVSETSYLNRMVLGFGFHFN